MKQKMLLKAAYDAAAGNPLLLPAAINEVGRFMGADLTRIINSHHPTDWPILAAVMRTTAEAMLPHLPEGGLTLYEDTLRDILVTSFKSEVRLDG